jgi:hypothetical protein
MAATERERDDFITAYIACALWSSNDESDESGGDPIDQNYGPGDLADATREAMERECDAFLALMSDTIDSADVPNAARHGGRYEQAGHDFWLNRNGHGCGFWDGDWSEPHASALDAASKAAGERNLYIGDDGRIYQ